MRRNPGAAHNMRKKFQRAQAGGAPVSYTHLDVYKRQRQSYAEHHRILDAIADRDGELAELLMRRHIRASRLNIEKQIAQGNLKRTEA